MLFEFQRFYHVERWNDLIGGPTHVSRNKHRLAREAGACRLVPDGAVSSHVIHCRFAVIPLYCRDKMLRPWSRVNVPSPILGDRAKCLAKFGLDEPVSRFGEFVTALPDEGAAFGSARKRTAPDRKVACNAFVEDDTILSVPNCGRE